MGCARWQAASQDDVGVILDIATVAGALVAHIAEDRGEPISHTRSLLCAASSPPRRSKQRLATCSTL